MFVNSLLRSKYAWLSAAGVIFLLWILKGDVSKAVKLVKLLGDLAIKFFTLIVGVIAIQLNKTFREIEDFQKVEEDV